MSSIYLDHAATTPMVEEALIAMTAQLARLGNPSSLHTHGRATRKTLEDAREVIAKEVGCLPSEVISPHQVLKQITRHLKVCIGRAGIKVSTLWLLVPSSTMQF